jgi:hypothetical protein
MIRVKLIHRHDLFLFFVGQIHYVFPNIPGGSFVKDSGQEMASWCAAIKLAANNHFPNSFSVFFSVGSMFSILSCSLERGLNNILTPIFVCFTGFPVNFDLMLLRGFSLDSLALILLVELAHPWVSQQGRMNLQDVDATAVVALNDFQRAIVIKRDVPPNVAQIGECTRDIN